MSMIFFHLLLLSKLAFTSSFINTCQQRTSTSWSATIISTNIRPYKQDSSFFWINEKVSIKNKISKQLTYPSSSCLSALPATLFTKAAVASTTLSRLALALTSLVLVVAKFKPSILWPNSKPDPSVSEPLPPGSLGCPFLGTPVFFGTKEHGAGGFWRKRFATLKNKSRLTKAYFMGRPIVAMHGSSNVRPMLDSEFSSSGVHAGSGINPRLQEIFGKESLFQARDKAEHSFLRRLIGQAMTPSSIAQAIPQLQKTANDQIDQILTQTEPIKMLDICTNFTLDVAWRQILGLNLKEDEIETFRIKVKHWISGIMSPMMFVLPTLRYTKPYKARKYLDSLLSKRIDQLRADGPDGSTLGAMVHATDEEGQKEKLSRQQLIDNSLLLILAGSETSANTLTTAFMLLGLHPDVFNKIKQEQTELIKKYSDTTITKAQLDNECPYLEAFIKETMRIKPLASGGVRKASDTLVFEGKQIPKSWPIMFNIGETHYNDPITYKEDGSHMDIKKGFLPERWLKTETRPSMEYMPFGYGYRYCLGANLAMAEMKIFIATFARNVDFDLLTNTDNLVWSKTSFIPIPEDGTIIKTRKSNFSKDVAVEAESTFA